MRFLLKAALGLIVVLGIADYRLWHEINAAPIAQHEFRKAALEEALFAQIANWRDQAKIQTLELIPGGEPDELGVRLGVSEVFDFNAIHSVEMDLKAYQVGHEIRFVRPCLRPAPPMPAHVFRSILRGQLGRSWYSVPIPDKQSKARYSSIRPLKGVSWGSGTVTLKVGWADTLIGEQDMVTGKVWPECKG